MVGDHAPVCGTNVLLSFLNIGERIASSDENWISLGTDEEESDVVRNYLYQLAFLPPIFYFSRLELE